VISQFAATPSTPYPLQRLAARGRRALACAALAALPALPAAAQDGPAWSIETDPLAFALQGYSLHVAREAGAYRFSAGVFAADVPEWVHGNEGFESSVRGVGLKLHRYLSPSRSGAFVGAELNSVRTRIERTDLSQAVFRDSVNVGVEAGYRYDLGRGFYATPWVAVSYDLDAADVPVGDRVFRWRAAGGFAAIHLGYRF
jgi:hypothetical protein